MFRNECPFCGCSDCRNNGLYGERFSYSKEDYCSIYNCRKRLKCLEKKYCSDHTKKCPNSNCRKEISIFDEYCSDHGRRCKYCHSNIVATYDNYCSQHINGCQAPGYCNKRFSGDSKYCPDHLGNCYTCGTKMLRGENGGYCFNHKKTCGKCSQKISGNEEFCYEHKKKCQFVDDNCSNRIREYDTYCSEHTQDKQVKIYREKWKKEERDKNSLQNEKNNLQTQLVNANAKITRAQANLGINNLDNLATELQNPAGDIWSLARWKEELEIERGKTEIIDNFYRRQFIVNNNLENVRNELSRQILEVNQEKRQKEQEIKELREIINSLENLVIQDEDVFLSEKVDKKRVRLEQLKVNIRNKLSKEWHDALDDLLEVKKALVKSSDNDFIRNQSEKLKQRLLKSKQVNKKELNELCQVQVELGFLELKQCGQEQQFDSHRKRPVSDWKNINPNFTPELVQEWQNYGFTYEQTHDWIKTGMNLGDAKFCAWLRDAKQLTPEQVLNHGNLEQLSQEFFRQWQQKEFQAQTEIPPH